MMVYCWPHIDAEMPCMQHATPTYSLRGGCDGSYLETPVIHGFEACDDMLEIEDVWRGIVIIADNAADQLDHPLHDEPFPV